MNRFLKYYEEPASRPIFETPDEMLKWAGLYNLTTRTLQDELVDFGLSPLLIKELVTVRALIDCAVFSSLSCSVEVLCALEGPLFFFNVNNSIGISFI